MKLCVSVCLQVVLVGGLWGSVGQELDPEVLIDKYNACNQKLQTIYYDLETTTQYGGLRPGKRVHSFKYCSNNEKKQWIGHWTHYKEDGTIDQTRSTLLTDIYGDKMGVHLQFYNPELENKRPPSATLVRSSLDTFVQSYSEHPPYGGSLTGQFFGSNHQSIYDLLKGASNLKLHNKVTKIIGHDTYLIEADTQYGIVKAWISPDLDYNCLKWEIIKEPNQFYRDGKFTSGWFTKWTTVYDAEKVEQIDGQYFITQAGLNYKVKDGNKVVANSTYHFNLKNFDLNPDYEALGAFEIQLPERTVVTHEEVPGIQFRWTNGKLVPDMDDYLYKNLTGKPLPSLESFMKGLEQDYNKGKMVLVFFWDMQQRSSRNLLRELAQKEEELEDKSLIVFLVHTSDVTADELQKWIEENNIPFTSGRITGEYQKVLLHWGVRAQPWLILTDKQHIVRAEGFTISELDTHIEELSPSSKTMTDTNQVTGVVKDQDISTVYKSNLIKHIQHLTALESRHITYPGNKKAGEYIIHELKKYGYSPNTDSFQAKNMTLYNVISDSSDKKKPVILLSAHFDSTSAVNGKLSSQAPGADDNASGVAALLELARILRKHRIQKNFEFVFFNCEEIGTFGSKHLSNKYRDNHWQIDYMINIDTIGTWKGPLSKTCPVNYVTDKNSMGVIKQLKEQFPYPLQKAKTMWRDDHGNFWNNGFKAIEITEDGCTKHMHKPTDTTEKLHYDNIAKIVHGLYLVLSQ